ncbi:unnamed protein product, partial [Candidula unifasciata]
MKFGYLFQHAPAWLFRSKKVTGGANLRLFTLILATVFTVCLYVLCLPLVGVKMWPDDDHRLLETQFNQTFRKMQGFAPVPCDPRAKVSEILRMRPIKFLPNFKNPCWWEPLNTSTSIHDIYANNGFLKYSYSYGKAFRKLTHKFRARNSSKPYRLRCLPYFFLAGQPKCGSTDFYNKIVSHPDVVSPPIKESHWWGKNRYGDASVSTLWSNDDWWKNPENCGLLEPKFTNADHVHLVLPQARIIVILRNPTDRLYSDFLYFTHSLKSQEDFHNEATAAVDSLNDCIHKIGIRACVYNASIAIKSRVRLRLGLYQVYLQDWLALFPRDQVLVVRLEDYSAEPLAVIQKAHTFLQL